MATKKKGARAARREKERAADKLTRDLERLALLEPGGSPERPIEIAASALVEVHVRSAHCPRCRGELSLLDHTAETIGTARLRVALVSCKTCGARRSIYFRLASTLIN